MSLALSSVTPILCSHTAELGRQAGYKVERHTVVTADGYILTMHHIPPYANPARRAPATRVKRSSSDRHSNLTSASWATEDLKEKAKKEELKKDEGKKAEDLRNEEEEEEEHYFPPVHGEDSKDINNLRQKLPNLQAIHKVSNPIFSHLDFLWATDARPLSRKPVLTINVCFSTDNCGLQSIRLRVITADVRMSLCSPVNSTVTSSHDSEGRPCTATKARSASGYS
ncbi:hypothetical protein E2C01_001743 [Portunus trituberculatus]|uniref:Partial AB-hydrolase lipase domain-containing protein n=1 Tax=Portunus trituberculatus TaxID=210409 RepID=A0A5B7CIE1_PORTR|nr:hypothetical protein [Portunus trituberculatus]